MKKIIAMLVAVMMIGAAGSVLAKGKGHKKAKKGAAVTQPENEKTAEAGKAEKK